MATIELTQPQMPRQFTVFLNSQDVREIEDVLCPVLPYRVACSEQKAERPVIIESLDPDALSCGSRTVVIFGPEEERHLLLTPVKRTYFIDTLRSPVVEFSRCYQSDAFLRAGRFYFHSKFRGPGNIWIDKSPQFVAWATNLFKLVKASLVRELSLDGAYVGRGAREWAAEPGRELRLL